MTSIRRARNALITAAAAAVLAVPAGATAEWIAAGRGFGHGVGMSQYGSYGYAKHGRSYKKILRHYFEDTKIAKTSTRSVRVLLTSGLGSISFSGATKACGKSLNKGKSYSFDASGSNVVLRRAGGSKITGCGGEGAAKGGRSVSFSGVGSYRGALIGRNVGGSLYAINKVGVEGYVKGVIPNEVPASWPRESLRVQAVAARSYGLASTVGGDGYDLYDDTRSQVYAGKSSETPQTNAATEDTAREVVKSNGEIATTFFFSTSGGRTEAVQYGFAGGSPRPYLKSEKDPYDKTSPVHKWRVTFSNSEMASKLGDLFDGKLKRIRVLQTGESPRIVRAKVVGSSDSTKVSGDALRFRLGLRSNWVRFCKRTPCSDGGGSGGSGGGGGGGGGGGVGGRGGVGPGD
jgi:stage II sporulation protein D